MSKSGKKIIEGAKEALSVVRGEVTAASIYVAGHRYVPVEELDALRSTLSDARAEARREALEEAANLIDGREWDTVIYEETTGDMLENIASALRALSQQEKTAMSGNWQIEVDDGSLILRREECSITVKARQATIFISGPGKLAVQAPLDDDFIAVLDALWQQGEQG